LKTTSGLMACSFPRSSFSSFLKLFFSTVALLLTAVPSARAQSAGTFSVTGSMATARRFPTETLLPNGKVLVIGGNTAAVELYDPVSGTFSPTGSMNDAREGANATLLNNGKVLVQGGESGKGTAELYDPATGVFTLTGTPTNFLSYDSSTATLLNNGKVLIVGGHNQTGPTGHTEIYDPATGTFSQTHATPFSGYNHTATLLKNGKVLIAGGDNFFDGGGGTYATAVLYDPSSDTFSAPIPMVAAREGHTATLLNNGKVLLSGGFYQNCCGLPFNGAGAPQAVHGSNEIFDPATNSFTRTGDLNGARYNHTGTMLPNGQVLIAGGTDFFSSFQSGGPVGPAELSDPAAGTFSVTGIMNTPRSSHAATLMNNGLVLLAGGLDASSTGLTSAELYHPATSSTATVAITSPANGATVSGTVTIAATVSASVQWINFYVDGNYLGSSPPYSFNWNSTTVADGSHILSVKVFNSTGQIGSDAKTVTVANNGTAGAVKITAPATGATVSGTVAITATVNSSVQWINIYIDGNYLASSPPYSFSWDSTSVANGTHVISAKAFNGSGLVGSDSVTVTVGNGATSGSVTITAPARGATVSVTVTISATVTAQVSWINIYIDGNYLASSPPYSFSWNSATVANGTHTISASAFNSSGVGLGNDSLNVTVAN
jgi:Bacterial Ig domain